MKDSGIGKCIHNITYSIEKMYVKFHGKKILKIMTSRGARSVFKYENAIEKCDFKSISRIIKLKISKKCRYY